MGISGCVLTICMFERPCFPCEGVGEVKRVDDDVGTFVVADL